MKRFLHSCRSQLIPGLCLGLALLVSALFAVYSFGNRAITVHWMGFFPLLLLVYALLGILLMVWHRRAPRAHPITPYLSGLNARFALCLPGLAWLLLFRLTGFSVLERCVLFNLLLLFALWLIEYRAARRLARDLNGALGRRAPAASLIVDLDECPQGAEAFCIEIERYCIKNHITYQFIERKKPAVILLDGVKHRVDLGVYYGYVPGWFLKFTEI